MRGQAWLLVGATMCLLSLQAWGCAGEHNEDCLVGNSLFQQKYNYPSPWWVVYPADVPSVANTALTLRSALTTSYEDFAQQIILAIARNQTQAIAKSIGYMVNANATLGGGCPVPPPPSSFLQRIGNGFAAAVNYGDNVTALFGDQTEKDLEVPKGGMENVNGSIVADTVLGAMFVAGRSCGPPDALSSSTLAAIRQKYINATCYYAGPILRSVTKNNTDTDLPPCYNATFESDLVLSNVTDKYVAGPLLSAYKECVVGPPDVLAVPSWLGYSFGPVVSIDTASTGTGGTTGVSASTGTGASAGTGGTTGTGATTGTGTSGGGSLLDGEFDTSTATTGR